MLRSSASSPRTTLVPTLRGAGMEGGDIWGPLDPPQTCPGCPRAACDTPQSSGLAPMLSHILYLWLLVPLGSPAQHYVPPPVSPVPISAPLVPPRCSPGKPMGSQGRSRRGREITHQKPTSQALTRLYSHPHKPHRVLWYRSRRTSKAPECFTGPAAVPGDTPGSSCTGSSNYLPSWCCTQTQWCVSAVLLCELKARGVVLLRATRHL